MFSKIGATVSNKYHVQLQKSIYCSEKSEGATIGILLKKTCNFIRKRLQYCEVYKNTRSSHQRCSIIKGVLINFAKFTGKHLCQSLFLNIVAGLRSATLLRKRLWHRFFPMNFAKFIRTPLLQNTSFTEHLWWLLLEHLF